MSFVLVPKNALAGQQQGYIAIDARGRPCEQGPSAAVRLTAAAAQQEAELFVAQHGPKFRCEVKALGKSGWSRAVGSVRVRPGSSVRVTAVNTAGTTISSEWRVVKGVPAATVGNQPPAPHTVNTSQPGAARTAQQLAGAQQAPRSSQSLPPKPVQLQPSSARPEAPPDRATSAAAVAKQRQQPVPPGSLQLAPAQGAGQGTAQPSPNANQAAHTQQTSAPARQVSNGSAAKDATSPTQETPQRQGSQAQPEIHGVHDSEGEQAQAQRRPVYRALHPAWVGGETRLHFYGSPFSPDFPGLEPSDMAELAAIQAARRSDSQYDYTPAGMQGMVLPGGALSRRPAPPRNQQRQHNQHQQQQQQQGSGVEQTRAAAASQQVQEGCLDPAAATLPEEQESTLVRRIRKRIREEGSKVQSPPPPPRLPAVHHLQRPTALLGSPGGTANEHKAPYRITSTTWDEVMERPGVGATQDVAMDQRTERSAEATAAGSLGNQADDARQEGGMGHSQPSAGSKGSKRRRASVVQHQEHQPTAAGGTSAGALRVPLTTTIMPWPGTVTVVKVYVSVKGPAIRPSDILQPVLEMLKALRSDLITLSSDAASGDVPMVGAGTGTPGGSSTQGVSDTGGGGEAVPWWQRDWDPAAAAAILTDHLLRALPEANAMRAAASTGAVLPLQHTVAPALLEACHFSMTLQVLDPPSWALQPPPATIQLPVTAHTHMHRHVPDPGPRQDDDFPANNISVLTWNVWMASIDFVRRNQGITTFIERMGLPDVIMMQEVTGWTLDVLSQASWWDRYHVWAPPQSYGTAMMVRKDRLLPIAIADAVELHQGALMHGHHGETVAHVRARGAATQGLWSLNKEIAARKQLLATVAAAAPEFDTDDDDSDSDDESRPDTDIGDDGVTDKGQQGRQSGAEGAHKQGASGVSGVSVGPQQPQQQQVQGHSHQPQQQITQPMLNSVVDDSWVLLRDKSSTPQKKGGRGRGYRYPRSSSVYSQRSQPPTTSLPPSQQPPSGGHTGGHTVTLPSSHPLPSLNQSAAAESSQAASGAPGQEGGAASAGATAVAATKHSHQEVSHAPQPPTVSPLHQAVQSPTQAVQEYPPVPYPAPGASGLDQYNQRSVFVNRTAMVSCMERGVLLAHVQPVWGGPLLVMATSHLDSFETSTSGYQQRITQLGQGHKLLTATGAHNIVWGGDFNWVDNMMGPPRLPPEWIDAWAAVHWTGDADGGGNGSQLPASLPGAAATSQHASAGGPASGHSHSAGHSAGSNGGSSRAQPASGGAVQGGQQQQQQQQQHQHQRVARRPGFLDPGITFHPSANLAKHYKGAGSRLDRFFARLQDWRVADIIMVGNTALTDPVTKEEYMVSDHFGLLMTLEPVELQGGLA